MVVIVPIGYRRGSETSCIYHSKLILRRQWLKACQGLSAYPMFRGVRKVGTDEMLPVMLLWILSPLVIIAGIAIPVSLFYLVRYRFRREPDGLGEPRETRP
jgi:hypothetical protein